MPSVWAMAIEFDAVQQSDTWIGNYQYNVRLTHPQMLINVPSSSKVPNETQRQVLIPRDGLSLIHI